eukprot:366390-Chlamydomonas_euryale.AAC.28
MYALHYRILSICHAMHNQENDMQGSMSSRELEWGNPKHIKDTLKGFSAHAHDNATLSPSHETSTTLVHPDVIIGSDVIYQINELDSLFFTLAMLCGKNTTILLSHENRDKTEGFHDIAKANGFVHRRVRQMAHTQLRHVLRAAKNKWMALTVAVTAACWCLAVQHRRYRRTCSTQSGGRMIFTFT